MSLLSRRHASARRSGRGLHAADVREKRGLRRAEKDRRDRRCRAHRRGDAGVACRCRRGCSVSRPAALQARARAALTARAADHRHTAAGRAEPPHPAARCEHSPALPCCSYISVLADWAPDGCLQGPGAPGGRGGPPPGYAGPPPGYGERALALRVWVACDVWSCLLFPCPTAPMSYPSQMRYKHCAFG